MTAIVFPTHMQQQQLKLSASGQVLGGASLFGKRIGFSGTPSDLLPIDLGNCVYDQGSGGEMYDVLTNPAVVSVFPCETDWTVDTLLTTIARGDFQALIDTGALITGLSNKAVAERLLARGLPWCEGVVYMNDADEKMVLMRATGRAVRLEQCGLPLSARFVFYDQIHTTGTDVAHSLNANAVVTLGKDMTWRDYAQGAYRMRGIGVGQRITVIIIPEVQELLGRELSRLHEQMRHPKAQVQALHDVASWLVINAMRSETLQANQLYCQSLAEIWRHNAFTTMVDEHRKFVCASPKDFVDHLLGDAFAAASGTLTAESANLHKSCVALICIRSRPRTHD